MGMIQPDAGQAEDKNMAAEENVLWRGGKGGRPSIVGLLLGLELTMMSAQNPLTQTQGLHIFSLFLSLSSSPSADTACPQLLPSPALFQFL